MIDWHLVQNLALASLMVGLTVTIHFFGLLGLLHLLRRRGHRFKAHESVVGQGGLILFVVFGILWRRGADLRLFWEGANPFIWFIRR
jgi:TM2 domain-containing membrane protein YozV